MIRKIVFLSILFLSIVCFSWYILDYKDSVERTLGVKQEAGLKRVSGFENFYNFDYLIGSSDKVFLYTNLENLSGKELKDKYNCSYLVNGGFYDHDFKPIGFLLSEGEVLSPWQKNRLFNGVFSVNRIGTARITRVVPDDPLRLALQSGPVVFENGAKVYLKSSIAFERRVLVGVTGDNTPVFLVFWSEKNFFGGPALEELPYLIEKINKDFNLNIADALNLDGGTASVFYGDAINLSEASKINSFFCIR